MQAPSQLTGSPRQLVLIVAAVLLVLAALASGYAIRLATSSTPAPTHASTVTSQSAPSPGSPATCIEVGGHRGC